MQVFRHRHVEARGNEDFVRAELEVNQPGRSLAAVAGPHGARVGLVGALVRAESHIAVDAEHRSLGVADERQGRRRQARRHCLEQGAQGGPHEPFVVGLVLGKPLTALIESQFPEEARRSGWKSLEWGRDYIAHRPLRASLPTGDTSPVVGQLTDGIVYEFSLPRWGRQSTDERGILKAPGASSRWTACRPSAGDAPAGCRLADVPSARRRCGIGRVDRRTGRGVQGHVLQALRRQASVVRGCGAARDGAH
mmetsp:Transcript_53761/g.126789  ORF Transcript_53761/g.126789 Transcript_53761/m.126789 type:complete len:251 (+) Transcript_53761:4157-4909(+)